MTMGQKAALVTGGATRLGAAMARALAADGYAVAIHYNTSSEKADALAEALRAGGAAAAVVPGDLSDPVVAAGVADAAAQSVGPLTLLINSASFYDSDHLGTLTLESWRRLTDVNLLAPVLLMQSFARDAAEGSAIVNMLDVQIGAPSPQFFSYFCAKSALEAATRLAALELAPRIRVNAIAPGLVLPSWGQTPEEFAERQKLTPLSEGLGAGDIVGAMRYLRDAPQVTGQVIAVDGGQRLLGFGNAVVSPSQDVHPSKRG